MNDGQIYEGVLKVRGRGVGFVPLDDFIEDIFIPTESLATALDSDIVRIRLNSPTENERRSGEVIEVIERAHDELIGTIHEEDEALILKPDNKRIHINPLVDSNDKQLVDMKVAATLAKWTDPNETPHVTITEVLGKAGEHETEMQAIIRSGGFATDFPPEVAKAAEELHNRREEIFKDALNDPKRRDMRDVTTFTIDPADAKDFDDALSVKTNDDGTHEIGIHIADVSHYVTPGDAIDQEARDRGTSIYLVDRVIPMLPEILSNDLCSLRPNEDRLAFSAVFTLDAHAGVTDEWYGQTVIHSDKRFSYEEAQAILDERSGEYHTELSTLMELSRTLRKRRHESGAIAFESEEVKFELDEDGTPIRAYTKERTETMMMIEDFMLLANREVATHIHELAKKKGKDAAFIYRIHNTPDPEKIEELATFLHALGYEFKTNKGVVEAQDINALLEEIEGTPEENLIKTATIRSMAKAVYSTKNIGHFGLAFKYYTHFTSPIRRYPDLIAHRMLRRHLDGEEISGKELARFERISVDSSERELEAVRAERDSIKYKQVEYMQDKVGEEFAGVITGVTDWGIYVEEKETKAEGMVHISNLGNDFFEHEKEKYHIKGQRGGKKFTLGDEVRIKLTNADLEERQLDFELIQ